LNTSNILLFKKIPPQGFISPLSVISIFTFTLSPPKNFIAPLNFSFCFSDKLVISIFIVFTTLILVSEFSLFVPFSENSLIFDATIFTG